MIHIVGKEHNPKGVFSHREILVNKADFPKGTTFIGVVGDVDNGYVYLVCEVFGTRYIVCVQSGLPMDEAWWGWYRPANFSIKEA